MAGNYAPHLPQWRAQMDPGLVACIEDGLRVSLVEYLQMRDRKMTFWDSVRPLFERYALLLTPSVSVTALEVGRLNPPDFPQHAWDWFPWASFSYPFNFTGQPAATVPAGFTAAGMPVGLMASGALIELAGYVLTIGVYCAVGLVFTLLIGLKWRASLWERSRTAMATSEPQRV